MVKKTVFGRRFEAVGANPRAARAAGVMSGYYQMAAYMGAALLYCSAGIFLAGLMQLPSAFQGDNYLMPSIAAVVLGGTSLFGGAGNLTATGFSVGVQYLFQGGAIVVGVGVYSVKLKQVAALFRRSPGQGLAPSAAGGA
jgi:ribose transport system permease protein